MYRLLDRILGRKENGMQALEMQVWRHLRTSRLRRPPFKPLTAELLVGFCKWCRNMYHRTEPPEKWVPRLFLPDDQRKAIEFYSKLQGYHLLSVTIGEGATNNAGKEDVETADEFFRCADFWFWARPVEEDGIVYLASDARSDLLAIAMDMTSGDIFHSEHGICGFDLDIAGPILAHGFTEFLQRLHAAGWEPTMKDYQ